eukprot:TRINITY_DN109295_c0_g1_i1.p1 TRINITY_DN109295_c0_g1~~TRINITY_DN109295_c0_g1_i1.p1  ORF type:complete len:216 (-),score=60.46 TRINITY_DN109295_c0_g1_i1:25-672(-)
MAETAGRNDLDDLDVFRELESNDLKVELLPAPGGRKRPLEEDALLADDASGGRGVAEDAEVSEEEDGVRIVLCDHGARSGGMNYYLGRHWEHPGLAAASGGPLALAPQGGTDAGADGGTDSGNTALALVLPDNQAELVEPDEGVDETCSKILFQMDEAELADTPWRRMGANLSDHFNFGLSEQEFKDFVMRQVRIRLEARQRRKIGVADSHALQP